MVESDRRRRFVLAASCAVLLAAAVAGPAGAGDMPSRRYRDPNAKFSFRFFADWEPVPLETQGKGIAFGTDKYLVAKFMEKGADNRGIAPGQIQSFRMGTGGVQGQTSGGETTPGDEPPAEDPFMKKLRELVAKDDPRTMKEVFEKTTDLWSFELLLDPKNAKDIKSKDGVPGQVWALDRSSKRSGNSYHHVFAVWKKDGMELGLWMWCPAESKKKFEQGFQAVAKSFMFFDPQAEEVKKLDVLEGLPISAHKRHEIEKGLVKGWAVMVSPKKNYIVIYDTRSNRNNLLAKVISDRIERIREQVYETRFPPASKVEAVSIVRICGDESAYHAYGGPWGSAGYWNSDAEELVFYDASPQREPDDDTLAVLYHEAFHQFIYYSVGEVSPHSWFNEGTGDYFSGSKYSGGKFTIKPFNWRVATIREAIRKGPSPFTEVTGREAEGIHFKFDRGSEGYTPLKAFVRLTQREYYSYPSICYAQGWSLVYFLREGVPKNPAWNEKWGKILGIYFDTLKREANKDKPLAPKKLKPEKPEPPAPGMGEDDPDPGADGPGTEPGMGEPGMGEPGMGEPGMGEPGMGEPGMGEPGMGEPGMGEPGMGEPGRGGPGMGDPGTDEPGAPTGEDPGIPMVESRMTSSQRALKAAVEAAFQGVDFDELEAAWKSFTLKVH